MLFSARRFIRRCLDGSIFNKGVGIIAQLGQAIGIPDLRLEDNSCTLSIDGTLVTIELDPAHSRLVISSYLADADELHGEAVWRALLKGTMDAIVDATGMVLAIDDAEQRVVIATALMLDDLSGEDVSAAIARFVARTELWKQRLDELARAPTADAPVMTISPTLFA